MTCTETKEPRMRAATSRFRVVLAATACTTLVAIPAQAGGAGGGISPGGDDGAETRTTSGQRAKLRGGKAIPPASAPRRVKRAIRAANSIEDKPYRYGGGHARWKDRGYDCSGAVSYALGRYGARVLKSPMPSGSFMNWEKRGRGKWITVYANHGHMYAVIAGLRWDTSQTPGNGPGWSKTKLHQRGYKVRHPRRL